MMRLALCLSGGGFRASLFHLGVLKRLHELDLLKRVHLISAVSGGAVTAACFQQYVHEIDANGDVAYDWGKFEAKLLGVTKSGLLDSYMKAVVSNMSLACAGVLLLVRALLEPQNLAAIPTDWLGDRLGSVALILIVVAVILYVSMVPFAYRNARDTRRETKRWEKVGAWKTRRWRLPSVVLAFFQPLSPGAMRTATMNMELFDCKTLQELPPYPRLYLAAIELNRGCEMVFSRLVLSELGLQGTVSLWEQAPHLGAIPSLERFGSPAYDTRGLFIAEAVAASSSYPPFFPPITINRGTEIIGSFVDGGVFDNAALNTPLELLLRLPENGPRSENFEKSITHLLVANAGSAQINEIRRWWPSWKSLRRVVDTMVNQQETNLANHLSLLRRCSGLKIAPISSQAPFLLEADGSDDCEIGIGHVRTHFDRFDEVETAVLVYSGYYWADYAFGQNASAASQRRSFHEVARSITRSETVSKLRAEEINRHLVFSGLRSVLLRTYMRFWLGRSGFRRFVLYFATFGMMGPLVTAVIQLSPALFPVFKYQLVFLYIILAPSLFLGLPLQVTLVDDLASLIVANGVLYASLGWLVSLGLSKSRWWFIGAGLFAGGIWFAVQSVLASVA